MQLNHLHQNLSNFHVVSHQQSIQAELAPHNVADSSDNDQVDHGPTKEINLAAMMAEVDDHWVLDSGSSSHYATSSNSLSDYTPATSSSFVTTTGGAKLPVAGQGCINAARNKKIDKVLYVPDLTSNLLSIGEFTNRGHLVLFNSKHCYILERHSTSKVFLKGSHDPRNRLYTLRLPAKPPEQAPTISSALAIFDHLTPANIDQRLFWGDIFFPKSVTCEQV